MCRVIIFAAALTYVLHCHNMELSYTIWNIFTTKWNYVPFCLARLLFMPLFHNLRLIMTFSDSSFCAPNSPRSTFILIFLYKMERFLFFYPPPPPLPLFFLRTAHRFFRSRAPSLSARLAASPPHPHVVSAAGIYRFRRRVRQLAAPTSFIGGRPVAARGRPVAARCPLVTPFLLAPS